ncbi:MAG TPA: hypothetical protein VMG60_15210 [Burkholderiaceae bacterium]|nr:hypothetical protein [Burkholderiaceae bacterium]
MKVDLRAVPVETRSPQPAFEVSELTVAQLVGKVYEDAPPAERGYMIEALLRPLGVLALSAIANGVFARMRLRGGLQDPVVRPDDIAHVRSADVVALADCAQEAGLDAVDWLGPALMASPATAASAAAAVLVAMLVQRLQGRRAESVRSESEPG